MYRISAEDAKKLRNEMKKAKNVLQYRKMEAVVLRGEGKKNEEIAAITHFHPDMIGRYTKEYLEGGLEALLFDGRKGGNHRNATDEEERAFIAQYEKDAQAGKTICVGEIAKAYDERFGKQHKSKSTVYYLLHKLGWRKVMPRSEHPDKATPEAIEASKKLTKRSGMPLAN
jgi:transposase